MDVVHPLYWRPKQFRAGDLDNSGSDRLLGNPKLSKIETLIREMAQNSWDARLADWQPAFHIRLREGTPELRQNLRVLMRNDLPDSPLEKSLQDPHFHVLEIVDRGTCGLDGPTDMSDGHPRNFQDLILKVGVPRGEGKGGGTFGFGKTAAYAYSRIGTVIYWSRCFNEHGELEHRFIVSAFRQNFMYEGVQYTGRHWWGKKSESDEIAPVIGEEARLLGESLFDWHFADDETGTSMLILHPPLRETVEVTQDVEDSQFTEMENFYEIVEEWGKQARHAIRRHLWPKIVVHPETKQAPMDISLTVNGLELALRSDSDEMIDLWARALNAVRLRQDGSKKVSKTGMVSVHEVTHQGTLDGLRKTRMLGHLAVLKRVPGAERLAGGEDLDPLASTDHGRIVRMRNVPELVVSSEHYEVNGVAEGMDWIAVFKPTEELDDVYAKAEPPAHDDWISEGLDRDRQLIIQHTERKIRRILDEVLRQENSTSDRADRRISTAKISKKLAGLLPVGRPAPQTLEPSIGGTFGGRRKAYGGNGEIGPRVTRVSSELVRTDEQVRQVQRVSMRVEGQGEEAELQLDAAYVGSEGVQDKILPEELEIFWEGARRVGAGKAVATVGSEVSAYVHAQQGRALKISVSARSFHGIN